MNSYRNQNQGNFIRVEYDDHHNSEDREVSEEVIDESEEEYGNDISFIPEDQREVFIDKAPLSIFELHRRKCTR
ncbi:hypothetical protein [Bacillus andreraoultii]|uniref:hypothetical protein n=1 Tax=Bacillus andreraoultii TaxID=1499685 RepID=UPI000539D5D5|nr:hypothetical protein [Bacillus andreraoultii]